MKISSASKKVLASALSAAMVVAFAPAAAFAAGVPGTVGDGEAVTITIDADGGTASQTSYTGYKQGGTISLPTATKNGYALAHWWYDADGDGEDDNNASEDFNAEAAFDLPAKDSGKTDVTLKAVYSAPSVTDSAYARGTGDRYSEGAKLTFNVDNAAIKVVAQHTYTLTVADPDGKVLAENTFAPADTAAETKAQLLNSADVTFKANPDSNANENAAKDGHWFASDTFLKSGEYTATLKDGDSVLSTAKAKLVKVTEVDGSTAKSQFLKLDGGKATYSVGSMINGKSWLDADGYAAAGTVSIKADTTFTSTSVTQVAGAGTYAGRVLTFSITDSTAANGDKYAISVSSPSGATVYTGAVTATGSLSETDVKFTFDQSSVASVARSSEAEVAGDYVMTVVKTPADGTAASTSKAKATLTEVKYDAGAGSFASGTTEAEKDYFVDGATTNATLLAAGKVSAPDGQDFDKWQAGEKTYAEGTSGKLSAGKVNTFTATYKAAAAKIATPTFTVEEKEVNKAASYVIKVSCATAGADVYVTPAAGDATKLTEYSTYYNAAEGGLVIAKSALSSAPDSFAFQAKYVAGRTDPSFSEKDSKVLTIAKNGDIATWAADTAGSGTTAAKLESLVGKSSTKWLATDGVKAAIESGASSIAAQGVYTSATAKEMTATKTAAYKALYEAVEAEAASQLAAYADNALVVVGDKAYYVEASDLAVAKKAVDKAAKAVDDAEAAAANVKGSVAVATYTAQLGAIIDAVNTATGTNAKASSMTADEIKAAEAVTAQLKAATDGTAAQAAIDAYQKLTDAQKKLVDTSALAAAHKVVDDQAKKDAEDAARKAAEELVKAQDKAAVAGITGKTVKAKAKKKVTAKLAGATSESGAVVTFSKKSGNAKVKVGAAGKITVKKGLKKGKKYTVKVTASCGAATKVVKVVVKVVK